MNELINLWINKIHTFDFHPDRMRNVCVLGRPPTSPFWRRWRKRLAAILILSRETLILWKIHLYNNKIPVTLNVSPHTDTNLQTKTQEKHWKEEISASYTMLGRLHIVLLVSNNQTVDNYQKSLTLLFHSFYTTAIFSKIRNSVFIKKCVSEILFSFDISGFLDKNNNLLYRSGKEVILFWISEFRKVVILWTEMCFI